EQLLEVGHDVIAFGSGGLMAPLTLSLEDRPNLFVVANRPGGRWGIVLRIIRCPDGGSATQDESSNEDWAPGDERQHSQCTPARKCVRGRGEGFSQARIITGTLLQDTPARPQGLGESRSVRPSGGQ